jgi:hypothetical protein
MNQAKDPNNSYFHPQSENDTDEMFENTLDKRHRRGRTWKIVFQISTLIGIIALATLILKIFNDTMGYAVIDYKIHPKELAAGGKTLDQMTCYELWPILSSNVSKNRLRTIERDTPREQLSQSDCYNLVMFEVAEPTAKKTWSLLPSILNFQEIQSYTGPLSFLLKVMIP